MNEDQLIDLETKIAFQEAAIESLQEVTIQQHLAIEALKKQLAQFEKRFEAALEPGLDIGPANEKPPHY